MSLNPSKANDRLTEGGTEERGCYLINITRTVGQGAWETLFKFIQQACQIQTHHAVNL